MTTKGVEADLLERRTRWGPRSELPSHFCACQAADAFFCPYCQCARLATIRPRRRETVAFHCTGSRAISEMQQLTLLELPTGATAGQGEPCRLQRSTRHCN